MGSKVSSPPSTPRERDAFGHIVLVVDWAMIALLFLNILLLLIDATFRGSLSLRLFLRDQTESLYSFYLHTIHENFALVDMLFVSIFLIELLARWWVAVHRQTYHRWFFYPLVHWYDVLGCIPIGSMRFLRVLRLGAIVYRMHHQGIINIERFYIYRVLNKYWDIFMEEVTDRVVVQVLDGVQYHVTHHSPMVERIWHEVIAKHKDEIASRVLEHAERISKSTLEEQQPQLHEYVDQTLSDALARSQHVFKSVHRIPFLGQKYVDEIETAIKVIVNNVIAELVADTQALQWRAVTGEVEKILSREFEQRDIRVEHLIREVIYDALEVIKEQVQVQRWKLREAAEAAQREAEKQALAQDTATS